jgi:hypothetical protein
MISTHLSEVTSIYVPIFVVYKVIYYLLEDNDLTSIKE